MTGRGVALGGGPSVQALSRRVALTTTAIVAVAYSLIAIAVFVIVTNLQTGQVDAGLREALSRPPISAGGQEQRPPGAFDPTHVDPNRPIILQWTVSASGAITSNSAPAITAVALPEGLAGVTDPQTVSIDGKEFRIAGRDWNDVHVVVAQSLATVTDTQTTLVAAELGIGGTLVLVVFLGAMTIGRRVAQPIEDARQRQLEFTADASHELRTPLSVIEAQTSLALAKERPEAWYRTAFQRVDAESRRIRRLVDDMLWLARFDATRGQPNAEPVNVSILAAATVDRFHAVAETRRLTLGLAGVDDAIVTVPPEWLDRLLGVLLDNACKYSPEGGSVLVSVGGEGKRVRLAVEDSGPGIPPDERERIFDRFHRATSTPGGAGLGLAIADAIVQATNGRWDIGRSSLGGASLAVSWPRSISLRREAQKLEETQPGAGA